MAENISTKSLSSQAYQWIKNDIVDCSLEPGQFIAQNYLAESYEVGLTPIREALRQLASEGYVQPVPRLGYIVSPVTSRDVEEIFEMRLILETSALQLAFSRGNEVDLTNLLQKANFSYTYKDRQSYSIFLEQNKSFHLSIAEISRNYRLIQYLSKTMDELARVFHLGLDIRDSASEMQHDHVSLAEALQQGDVALAERLIRSEILLSRERVMEALQTSPRQSLASEILINKKYR